MPGSETHVPDQQVPAEAEGSHACLLVSFHTVSKGPFRPHALSTFLSFRLNLFKVLSSLACLCGEAGTRLPGTHLGRDTCLQLGASERAHHGR